MNRRKDFNQNICRVTVYDWLRLLATIFVVIGHSAYLNIQTTYGGVAYDLPESVNPLYYSSVLTWLREVSGWVYGFHMPLFFMLSGAVMAIKPLANFDIIVRSKVKRLLIPYFICGWFFMLPIKRLGNFYSNDSLLAALRGFLSGADSGHLWFLTALFWCIIAFVLLKKILDKFKISSCYALIFVSGIIYFTYSYFPFDILGLKTGLSYLIYFALGYVFEIERASHQKWNIKKTTIAYLGMLLIEIINWKYNILNQFFAIIIGSFMTYILADILDRVFCNIDSKRVWRIIIRNLFYVYLLHDPLEYIVLRIFNHYQLLTYSWGCILYTLARTIIIFVITIIIGELISKTKKVIWRFFNS